MLTDSGGSKIDAETRALAHSLAGRCWENGVTFSGVCVLFRRVHPDEFGELLNELFCEQARQQDWPVGLGSLAATGEVASDIYFPGWLKVGADCLQQQQLLGPESRRRDRHLAKRRKRARIRVCGAMICSKFLGLVPVRTLTEAVL